jgi:hypothetical protein
MIQFRTGDRAVDSKIYLDQQLRTRNGPQQLLKNCNDVRLSHPSVCEYLRSNPDTLRLVPWLRRETKTALQECQYCMP